MSLHRIARLGFLLSYVAASPQAIAADFACLIEPNQVIELGSPVTGRLDRVSVKRGDLIEKNQVLATLEAKAERAAAELAKFKSQQAGPSKMAESKMIFSKRKLIRLKELAGQRLKSAQESEDTEAELRVAEAELLTAKENLKVASLELQQQNSLLELRAIRSPVDGVVVDQGAFQGEVFEPGSENKYIYKVAEMNPLKVHLILPKNLFGKIKHGMAADISPEIPQGEKYSAKVTMIDRLVDAASGTFVVFLELPNPKYSIPAGVKCTAAFLGLGEDAVAPTK